MKKSITIFLVILMTISFSACKANDSNNKSSSFSEVQTDDTTTTLNKNSKNTSKESKKNPSKDGKKIVSVYVYVESNGMRVSVNDFEKIDEQIRKLKTESIETDVKMTSKIATCYKVYSDNSEKAVIETYIGSDNCYYLKVVSKDNHNKYYKIEQSKEENIFDIFN